MQRFLSPAQKLVFGVHPKPFHPFGKARATNVLEDFIPLPSRRSTRVLLLNATDLHSTLETVSSSSHKLQDKHLQIRLNNSCELNVARNLLFFYIISRSPHFSATQEDFQYLWDVWFNLGWSDATKKRFTSDVKSLLDGKNLPPNAIVNPEVLEHLRQVWSDWLSSISRLSKRSFMTELHNQRKSSIISHLGDPPCYLLQDELQRTPEVKILNLRAFYELGDLVTVGPLPQEEKLQLLGELALYYFYGNGNCNLMDDMEAEVTGLNPTFFGPSAKQWLVHPSVNPFNSFLPLPLGAITVNPKLLQETFYGSEDTGFNLRIHRLTSNYCRQKLASLLNAFKNNMDDKVQLVFHNEDPLQLCYNTDIPRCDVIDCSDLADEVGLANVILSATNKVVQQPNSLLLTETRLWKSDAASPQPNLEAYVKEGLCDLLSMIPTLYGVRLATPVQLGSFSPPDITYNVLFPRCLKWRPAPSFNHVTLYRSGELRNSLNQLKERCNLDTFARPGSKYTPLTYSYVCSGVAQRVGNLRWSQFGLDKVDRLRQTSRKTIEDWKKGRPIFRFYFSLPFSSLDKALLTGDPFILVLAPSSLFVDPPDQVPDSALEDLHCLDTANFRIIRSVTSGEIQELEFSFLLPGDHGFKFTHYAMVVNNWTDKFLLNSAPLWNMKMESFTPAYPYVLPTLDYSFSVYFKKTSRIACFETDTRYDLQVILPGSVQVSTVDCITHPSYRINVIMGSDSPPLEFSFTHPVDYTHQDYRDYPFISKGWGLRAYCFRKSFYEPLPQDFQRLKKWDTELLSPFHLPPLTNGTANVLDESHGIIKSHLDFQSVRPVKGYEGLDNIRSLITEIFTKILEERTDGVFVIGSWGFCLPHVEWYLRAHLPLRISPDGAPMLILSALDTPLAKHLEKTEPLKKSGNFLAVEREKSYTLDLDDQHFSVPCFEPSKYLDEETAPLFRYLLRYNSTKILPNSWQNNHIAPEPGKPSPCWLTTFITPLYPDCPLPLINKRGSKKTGQLIQKPT